MPPLGRSSYHLQTSCYAPWSGGSTAGKRTNPSPSPSAARSLFLCGGTPLSRRQEMPRDSRCRAPWTAALRSGGRASPRSGNAKKDRLNSGFLFFRPERYVGGTPAMAGRSQADWKCRAGEESLIVCGEARGNDCVKVIPWPLFSRSSATGLFVKGIRFKFHYWTNGLGLCCSMNWLWGGCLPVGD